VDFSPQAQGCHSFQRRVPLQSGCSALPSGRLSGKGAQNKWETNGQLVRKAAFLAPQSACFLLSVVFGAL